MTEPDRMRLVFSKSWGLRVGHWPCLGAVFIQLSWGSWRYSAWWGEEMLP